MYKAQCPRPEANGAEEGQDLSCLPAAAQHCRYAETLQSSVLPARVAIIVARGDACARNAHDSMLANAVNARSVFCVRFSHYTDEMKRVKKGEMKREEEMKRVKEEGYLKPHNTSRYVRVYGPALSVGQFCWSSIVSKRFPAAKSGFTGHSLSLPRGNQKEGIFPLVSLRRLLLCSPLLASCDSKQAGFLLVDS